MYAAQIPAASKANRKDLPHRKDALMRNCVHLITYANRLGGDRLEAVQRLLDSPLKGIFGGVHLLPFFYPMDDADAGFDPIDHLTVDPQVGTWNDIAALSDS